MTYLMTNRQSIRPRWLICSHHEIIHHFKPIPFVWRIYFPGLCTTKTNELPRDRARVCFIPRPRDQIRDTRDPGQGGMRRRRGRGPQYSESCPVVRGIEKKSQNFKKTTVLLGVKWRLRLLLQSNVRSARVCWHDTRKTSALLTSSLFAILLFARGGANQLATSGSLGHEIWIVYTKLKTWVSIKM